MPLGKAKGSPSGAWRPVCEGQVVLDGAQVESKWRLEGSLKCQMESKKARRAAKMQFKSTSSAKKPEPRISTTLRHFFEGLEHSGRTNGCQFGEQEAPGGQFGRPSGVQDAFWKPKWRPSCACTSLTSELLEVKLRLYVTDKRTFGVQVALGESKRRSIRH